MSNPFVNADQVNAVIKVRRGLEVDRLQTIYEDGEVIYSVDKRRVFIGDGVGVAGTYGGNVVGNLNFCSDNYQKNLIEKYDLVYRTDTNGFFLLTGDDYDLPESYVLVGGPLMIPPPPPPYVLSAATRTRRGGVEIREGLKVDNGRVSVDYDENTMALNGANQLTLNTDFTARMVNDLPQASYIKYGAVMVNRDTGLRIEDGKLSVAIDDDTIKLDPNVDEFRLKVNMGALSKATKTTAGILKLGYGLTVDGDTVSVDLDTGSMAFYGNKIGTSSGTGGGGGGSTYTPVDASYLTKGIVQITPDTGLKIVDGNLSLSIDNDTIKVKTSPTGTKVLYSEGGGGSSGGLVGLTKNQFKGTGVSTYKLTNFTDNDYDNYIVFVNGVQQVPGDAYTISTPNIIFSGNIINDADIVVYCATKSTGGGGGSGTGSDSLPIGTVIYFAVSTAPVGFLECDGSLHDTSDYPELSLMIGDKFLLAGETSPPSGKFRLPDLRSEFIRGWDHGKGIDTNRIFGSKQIDDFKSHTHSATSSKHSHSITFADSPRVITSSSAGETGNGELYPSEHSSNLVTPLNNTINVGDADIFVNIGSTGGTETRPRNVALLPCIKAETTVSPFVAANFIPKPATATNGQVLTYDGGTKTWSASAVQSNIPVNNPVLDNTVVSLAINRMNTSTCCGIDGNGRVFVFGSQYSSHYDSDGANIDPSARMILRFWTDVDDDYLVLNPTVTITKLMNGQFMIMALLSDGTLWVSGANDNGTLGVGTTYVPSNDWSRGFRRVRFSDSALISDFEFSCNNENSSKFSIIAKSTTNNAYIWGGIAYGSFAGNITSPLKITQTGITNNVKEIIVTGPGNTRECFGIITLDKNLYVTGYNNYGQLGVASGNTTDQTTWIQPKQADGNTITSVNLFGRGNWYGATNLYVIKDDGTIWVSGRNNSGQLGDGTTTNSTVFKQVAGVSNVTKLLVASYGYDTHENITCIALTSDGKVYTWGSNAYGAVGNGTSTRVTSPYLAVSNGATDVYATAGYSNGVALGYKKDNRVYVAGYNAFTTPTSVSTNSTFKPLPFANVKDLILITHACQDHSANLVLTNQGVVYGNGVSNNKLLGDNDNNRKMHFVKLT